eukprot:5617999-Amphidinium_carterae.1
MKGCRNTMMKALLTLMARQCIQGSQAVLRAAHIQSCAWTFNKADNAGAMWYSQHLHERLDPQLRLELKCDSIGERRAGLM